MGLFSRLLFEACGSPPRRVADARERHPQKRKAAQRRGFLFRCGST